MNVLFDHQIFTMQRFGGISRYLVELIKNFPADISTTLPLSRSHNIYLRDELGYNGLLPVPGKRTVWRYINSRASVSALKRGGYDVFHPTYYDDYFLRHLRSPFVLTVHDLTHERFPQFFAPDDPTAARKERLIRAADAIIAISESTRRDIIDYYGVSPERITMIHHGSVMLSPVESPVPGLPQRYILFVGDRHGYKNFSAFVDAIASIAAEFPDLNVVCTGRPFRPEELDTFRRLGLDRRMMHVYATDSQMHHLFTHALCFVFPSLYEGFGFPILEAFECGCPVALSNASCFPEVAADAGEYFDPTDPADMARAIRRLILDRGLRADLAARGHTAARRFTWHDTALRTAALYRTLT